MLNFGWLTQMMVNSGKTIVVAVIITDLIIE